MSISTESLPQTDRRRFLERTAGAAATAALASAVAVHADDSSSESASKRPLRIGLVGAGGRGGGAITDSLSINEGVSLVAIADLDLDKAERLVNGLSRRYESAVDVQPGRIHVGLDGYQAILDADDIDVVLFATPPAFRATQVLEAVQAGKHVFAEKPTCVDPAGYRICLQADRLAQKNGTSIVTGTQYRRQTNYVDVINKIHAGEIGDVIGATSRYCSTGIWYRARRPEMSDTEYQLFNWMHFIWLSGDQITEQAVHNIDLMNWLMGDVPETAYGGGGRFTRPADSEMWDSMAIDYRYPGDRMISFMCRQIPDTASENRTVVYASGGTAEILGTNGGATLKDADGKEMWSMKGDIGAAYQQEHKDLIDSIRANKPIVEFAETARSSLTAVMGRLAAYSGQEVTWDFVSEQSKLDLMPKNIDMAADRVSSYAIPGEYKLV